MQLPPEPQLEPEAPLEPPTKKPRRKRRTKAEMEAIRAEKAAKALEEANKPIDPQVWLLLGGLLLVVGAIIFFIPGEFYDNGQSGGNNPPWIYMILLLMTAFLGKNPTALLLAVIGLLSLAWGARGWVRKRTGAAQPQPDEMAEN